MIDDDRPVEPDFARLINRRWGFTSEWVALPLALEQFESHPSSLQDGLLLEWQPRSDVRERLDPARIRSLIESFLPERTARSATAG